MKTIVTSCLCAFALTLTALGQTPTPPPDALTTPVASPALTVTPPAPQTPLPTMTPIATFAAPTMATPSIAPTPPPRDDDEFDRAIEKKIRKHFNVTFDGDHHGRDSSDVPWVVIPIVLIVFATPVMIVATILYFSFSRSRAMHRTVRMLVEKGQPVPEALLNPPPIIRQRSDLRRGVVLLMVGAGLMVFFGAVNDWEGGAWSIGMIPFLIGLGYLLVWRLDVRRDDGASPRV